MTHNPCGIRLASDSDAVCVRLDFDEIRSGIVSAGLYRSALAHPSGLPCHEWHLRLGVMHPLMEEAIERLMSAGWPSDILISAIGLVRSRVGWYRGAIRTDVCERQEEAFFDILVEWATQEFSR